MLLEPANSTGGTRNTLSNKRNTLIGHVPRLISEVEEIWSEIVQFGAHSRPPLPSCSTSCSLQSRQTPANKAIQFS